MSKTALVVSAHAADFVFRAGGAIALHAEQGWKVTVLCLSLGEKGESTRLWRQPGATLDQVKVDRRAETEAAARTLDVHDLHIWDLGDHPLVVDRDTVVRLAALYRSIRPGFVIGHWGHDVYNPDHVVASELLQHARILAQVHGHEPDAPVIGAPPVYSFEPYQTELSGWTPDTLLDITKVWPTKRAAIECMTGQEQTWEYHTRASQQRGAQAARNSALPVTFAEGFSSVFPRVAGTLG